MNYYAEDGKVWLAYDDGVSCPVCWAIDRENINAMAEAIAKQLDRAREADMTEGALRLRIAHLQRRIDHLIACLEEVQGLACDQWGADGLQGRIVAGATPDIFLMHLDEYGAPEK